MKTQTQDLSSLLGVDFFFVFCAVHSSYRHLEHRMYICRVIDWKTPISGKKRGPSAGPDDRHAWEPITRGDIQGLCKDEIPP